MARGWRLPVVAFVLLAAVAVASSCGEEPPAIDEVQIAGNQLSAQVRQGIGPISIEIRGRGLQHVETAWLEDLPVTLRQGTPDGGVTVDLVIPHGTTPGTRDLTLTLAENRPILTHAGAVEVTTIRATADGDDTTGRGTPQHPFRSLSKALGLAAGGDQVELGPGTYNLSTGERWPEETRPGPPPTFAAENVPDGLILKGAGSAVTALDGTGSLVNTAALVFGGGASVEGMTLRTFHRGLVVGRGVVNTTDLIVNGCAAEGAIVFGSATLRLNSATVSQCATGVRAIASATVSIGTSNVTGNGVGVEYANTSKGQISASGVSNNTGAGVVVATGMSDITLDAVTVDRNGQAAAPTSSGVHVTGTPRLTLRGGSLAQNQGSGLHAIGGVLSFTNVAVARNGVDGLTLAGVQQALVDRTQIFENGGDGVRVTAAGLPIVEITASTMRANTGSGVSVGAGTTTVRASTVESNALHGIRVQGQAALSLPWNPAQDAQETRVTLPQPSVNACLSDERVASASSTISVVHATLQGTMVAPGLVAGPADARPQYRILNAGNEISFLP